MRTDACSATRDLGSEILSGAVYDLDHDGQQELIFATRSGDVWVLSPDLSLRHKRHLGLKAKSDQWAELLAIGDLNADDLPELIIASHDYQAASPLNPGYLTRPQTVYTTSVYTVSVLDNHLRVLADYTTKGIWTNMSGRGAIVSGSGNGRHNGFPLLADRPVIMELRPRRFPGF